MAKGQTIIWTALPHGRAADGSLRLSAVVTPRLWNTDASVTLMHLADFPEWLDFPAQVAAMTFEVEFDGVVRPATVELPTVLRPDLWKALFDAGTPVFPYRFEDDDTSGAQYLVLETSVLGEFLGKVYAEVGTDPALGAGKDLPKVVDLAAMPGVKDVARPTRPEPPYQPPAVDTEPVPAPELPTPPEERPGCLEWLLRLLCWLARYVPWLKRVLGDRCRGPGAAHAEVPDFQVEPFEPGTHTAPVVMPTVSVFTDEPDGGPAPSPSPGSVSAPTAAQKAAFEAGDAYFTTKEGAFGPLKAEDELAEQHDFHQIVSLLGDYPALLRRLGLVVDLVVAADPAIPTAVTSTVRVRATWTPVTTPAVPFSPRTHYVLDGAGFAARPRDGAATRISNGYLDLSDPARNPVTQIDVAGSTIKYRNAATNLVVSADPSRRPPLQPEQDGLPALQTEGLAVTQAGILTQYKQNALAAKALHNFVVKEEAAGGGGAPAAGDVTDELWADTVVRGYRVDVQDVKAGTWFSLHRRDGRYDFLKLPAETLVVLDEEGFVEPGAARQPDTPNLIRIHETLFSWQGWSLSVPRPHRAILADDTSADPPVGHLDSPPLYGLNPWYRVTAGSLPRLRYGREYRLRAREVDLAGNSVCSPGSPAFAETPAEATPPVRFGRFEPVGPPSLMPRAPVAEGASVERMVVRSDHDSPAADMAAKPDERHVVPPRATQALAEQHGMLDTAIGGPALTLDGSAATKDLAGREAGTLTHRLDLATTQRVPLDGAQEVVVKDSAGKETGRYWIQSGEQFPLAYLPDPIAAGAQFLALPGAATTRVAFDGAFPDFQPFRLQVVGIPAGQAPAPPAWSPADRVLVVEVPQGRIHSVRYSSYRSAAGAAAMGAEEWVKRFTPGRLGQFQQNADAGRHWMLMPFRTLTLVHAVRQPLAIPRIATLSAEKEKKAASGSAVGETSAVLKGTFELDAGSTGKVQVRATWRDPLDDPAKPGFDETDVTEFAADVGEVQVASPANDTPSFALTHFVKDTKYHRIRYTPVGTTRFREYFDPSTPAEQLVRPTAAEVASGATAVAAAAQEVDIPNSARPAPPRIHSVVPAFRWDEAVSPGGATTTVTRTRVGGGLRVYLERPWFSTGWGERLGVVFARPGQAAGLGPEERQALITSVAADPVYAPTALPEPEITSADELLTSVVNEDVTLAENGEHVSVGGFDVRFDLERRLWYSDVELASPAAYLPFVRLALVRFQPVSVPGAHVSPVVRADYAQLLPDRTASFRFEHGAAGTVKVTVGVKGVRFDPRPHGSRTGWTGMIERRVGPTSAELEWERAGEMDPEPTGADVLFRARFDLTGFQPGQFRVVVREYELFPADEPDPAPGDAGAGTERDHGHRLVYADACVVV